LAVAFNIALLGFFKYTDFLLESIGASPLGIALPLGISFYVFQAMSYVSDVYRGQVGVQRNIISFGTYVMMFPQLVAGPIVRYSDIEGELSHRRIRLSDVSEGLRIFAVGLCKKVLFANRAGEIREIFLTAGEGYISVLGEWAALILYAFQIYYDFGGYSDMAVGLGRIFGFSFPRNFNYPYIAKSITDFWRRWHITLSSWFREYVYIPLGGNRCSRGRVIFNLLVTWTLTGIWHGAAWNFVIWGLYFFCVLLVEKSFLKRFLERLPSVLGHIYALFFILIGWLIFTSEDGAVFVRLGRLFGIGVDSIADGFAFYEIVRHGAIIILFAVGVTPAASIVAKKIKNAYPTAWEICEIGVNILAPAGIIISTATLVGSSYNPFLYFRF
jgi:alginate O-acetyltransferase complex protein AlgI